MILRNSEQQILVRLISQNIIEYQITIKIIQNDLYIILLNAQILIPSPRNASSMTIILIEQDLYVVTNWWKRIYARRERFKTLQKSNRESRASLMNYSSRWGRWNAFVSRTNQSEAQDNPHELSSLVRVSTRA